MLYVIESTRTEQDVETRTRRRTAKNWKHVFKAQLCFTDSLAGLHATEINVFWRLGAKLSGVLRHGTSGKNKRIVRTTLRVYNQQAVENETGTAECWKAWALCETCTSACIFANGESQQRREIELEKSSDPGTKLKSRNAVLVSHLLLKLRRFVRLRFQCSSCWSLFALFNYEFRSACRSCYLRTHSNWSSSRQSSKGRRRPSFSSRPPSRSWHSRSWSVCLLLVLSNGSCTIRRVLELRFVKRHSLLLRPPCV